MLRQLILQKLFLLSREQHALLSKRSALRANCKSAPGTKPGLAVDYGGVSLPAKERGSNPSQQGEFSRCNEWRFG